jgi:predicted DCC family thiol-disulfide oxidoreductase YuxK
MSSLSPRRVKSVPRKPLFIYDGDCGFCLKWVRRLQQVTGDRIEIAASQEVAKKFPEISSGEFDASIQYIDANGEVHSAARGCFEALAQHPLGKALRWVYRATAPLCEVAYRFVAKHRSGLSKLDLAVSGLHGEIPAYSISTRLFAKSLAVIFFIAFANLFGQITGLVGPNGITPASSLLENAYAYYDLLAFYKIPTVFWISSSDFMLQTVCATGMLLAVAVFFDLAPALGFFLLWFLYLSLVNIGNVFLSFQWDALLLEAGFLGIFISPLAWRWRKNTNHQAPVLARWLLLWLLFRLLFSSGALKLLSGDETWHHLTALQYHFETQPLPSPLAFFIHQLPPWMLQFAVIATLFIEVLLPLCIYAPRRLQLTAACGFVLLQILIFLTGNYGFFNPLTVAICLWLVDDVTWRKIFSYIRHRIPLILSLSKDDKTKGNNSTLRQAQGERKSLLLLHWRWYILVPLSLWLAILTVPDTLFNLGARINWPAPITWANELATPFRSVNSYGLFAVMTTKRQEITLQGSDDGTTWFDYSFKWKPGNTGEMPSFCQPYLPRLDFQLWFAALGNFEQTPWFIAFCQRLLHNSPQVTSLLANNPFPDHPPRYLRTNLYEYHFSKLGDWWETGNWWSAEFTDHYSPVISLKKANEN